MSNDRPPQRARRGAPVRRPHHGRTLGVLLLVAALLFGAVGAGSIWSDARWAPGLALDLEGGTQVLLTPRPTAGGGEVTEDQLQQARNIIEQRVNGTGINESEVSIQGGENIVVSIPGEATRAQLDLISQSSQLSMRVVLVAAEGAPAPAGDPAAEDPAAGDPAAEPADPAAEPAEPTDPAAEPADPAAQPTDEAEGAAAPAALRRDTAPEPAAEPTGAPAPAAPEASPAPPTLADVATPRPTPGPGQPTDSPATPPADASDQAWLTEDVGRLFTELDCSDPANLAGGTGGAEDPALPLVTCSQDGSVKYVLGPAEIQGTQLTGSSARQAVNQQGQPTGGWAVDLQFNSEGGDAFEALTARISQLEPPRDQFAAVLDGLVVTAPSVSGTIPGGRAEITGNFTQESADALAQQLRFGALPLSFDVQSEEQLSATLGSEQLRNGIIAGLVGLALVVAYFLIQYRALGLVTVTALVVAALLNWGVILLLSWLQGFRLSLAGVAGLIIAIGTTADSFIIFFERVRDEIREGRVLASAVEAGWRRARRTILISNAVTFISAVVLYVLAVGNVRGFAYTLGITTVIDLVVVALFTHPVVALLARTRFFGGGHKWSGFDPEHLGSVVARSAWRHGQVRKTVAQLRAEEREKARAGAGGGGDPGGGSADDGTAGPDGPAASERGNA
ncbi:protein translocase subunit SecD [Kineococcus terrestris]|uniref:protein translocase subunit SecD n=1 Tax=Kineococcus terrestris TaxID=2044856 RepID=UPI0034DAFC97